MRKDFSFQSSDKKTTIHAIEWPTKNKPKAILQISHGMCEHILRYDDFAKFLNKNNIYVCGNDHLGHGKSITETKNLGYFCENKGHFRVVDDLKQLHDITKEKYPNIPYFLLGHSMGSFMAREYCIRYGKSIDGAIIMGTGFQSPALLSTVKKITTLLAKFKGWHHRSHFLQSLVFKSYNKKIKNVKTGFEWLSKDNAIVKQYKNDSLCGYVFTLNGFYNLFDVMSYVQNKNNISKVPKNLPILVVAGQEDPVGAYGKGPIIVRDLYKDLGVKDVRMKLYENDRHEILNETDKETVYNDILNWFDNYLL